MIKRLSNHIKKVLIQDNCCIVPLLGGFVCENIPAFKDEKKGFIMPPSSEIYFNRNLSHDDGLLQQSYATTYSLSMRRAKAMLDSDLKDLQECLVRDKKVFLSGIGELTLSEDGSITFNRSYHEYGDSPMYGLVPVVISGDSSYKYQKTDADVNKNYINIRVSKKSLNVAAVLIAMVFVLLPLGEISTNREVYKAGISSFYSGTSDRKSTNKGNTATDNIEPTGDVNVELNKDVKPSVIVVDEKPEVITPKYYVIVSSDKKEKNLDNYKKMLVNEGFENVTILSGKNMSRLSIACFDTEREAYSFLNELRGKSSKFNTAWVYKN